MENNGDTSCCIPKEIPTDLLGKVIKRIDVEKKFLRVRKLFAFVCIGFIGLAALTVPVAQLLWREVVGSGFMEYIRLALVDFKSITTDWQDFGFSLLETAPILNVVAALSVLFGILLAIRWLIINSRTLFTHGHTKIV